MYMDMNHGSIRGRARRMGISGVRAVGSGARRRCLPRGPCEQGASASIGCELAWKGASRALHPSGRLRVGYREVTKVELLVVGGGECKVD